MGDALEDQVASYAAGAIVPAPRAAGSKRGAAVADAIAREATALAAKRRAAGQERTMEMPAQIAQPTAQVPTGEQAISTSPNEDTNDDLGVAQSEQDPMDEEGPKAQAKQGPQGQTGWLTVSIPQEAREPEMQVTKSQVKDAVIMMLMELTDESREGGAVEGVPEKPKSKDDTKEKGPWFYEFENKNIVRTILGEWGHMLPVDTTEGQEVLCAITLCKDTANRDADSLAAAAGFWGEIFVGKEKAIHSKEAATKIVAEQLGVIVHRCKYPRNNLGSPPNKSKISFTAELMPGEDRNSKKLPAVLKGNDCNGNRQNMTYRIEKGYFPNLCNRCHQPIAEDADCAICKRDKDNKAYAKSAREKAMANHRESKAKASKAPMDPAQAAAAKGHQEASQRARKATLKACRDNGICPFFHAGRCNRGDTCPLGKHQRLPGA